MNDTQKDKKQLVYWITCAQLISMVLIVLSHAVPENVDIPAFISGMTPYLQSAGLTVFMWTGGYLAIKTKKLEKYGYLGYFKRRIKRLLIPYVFFSLLMLVPKYVLAAYPNSEVSLNLLFVLKQLITPREGIQPHLWFLPTLLLLSLLLPLWKWCLRRTSTLAACSIVLLALQFIPTLTNVLCINDVLQYAFYFYFGLMIAEKIELGKCKKRVTILLPIISTGGYVLTRILLSNGQIEWLLYKLLCLSSIIMLSLVIQPPYYRCIRCLEDTHFQSTLCPYLHRIS